MPTTDGTRRHNSDNSALKHWILSIGCGSILFCILLWEVISILDQAKGNGDNALLIFASSSLLCLVGLLSAITVAAFVLLRRALLQQHELMAAHQDRIELKNAYAQVVENLPVGLFTYGGEAFHYTNWAWDEQVMRRPVEAPIEAFRRAIHSEDREEVFKELKRCCQNEEPVHLKFRIVNDLLDPRHIELRGVPVYETDGRFRHILGFCIDVSEVVRASNELTHYNLEVEQKNLMLTNALGELETNFTAMVDSLVKAVEAKDPYTAGHSERVMHYSLMMGESLQLTSYELRILKMGTLVHDIGKIGIPDEILTKPSRLTTEEFEVIKRHPETGYEMIQGIPMFRDCAPIVRFHHERLDGSGYPMGLKGDDIPNLVQIAAVADIFDAMTSNRAYRRGLPIKVAIEELRKEAALGRLNPMLVELFAGAILKEEIPSQKNWRRAA